MTATGSSTKLRRRGPGYPLVKPPRPSRSPINGSFGATLRTISVSEKFRYLAHLECQRCPSLAYRNREFISRVLPRRWSGSRLNQLLFFSSFQPPYRSTTRPCSVQRENRRSELSNLPSKSSIFRANPGQVANGGIPLDAHRYPSVDNGYFDQFSANKLESLVRSRFGFDHFLHVLSLPQVNRRRPANGSLAAVPASA